MRAMIKFASKACPHALQKCGVAWAVGILPIYGHWVLLSVFSTFPISQLTEKLVHWLSPYIIFGAEDKIVDGLTEAWCIAKIRRLVGPLDPQVNAEFEEDFAVAEYLESNTFIHPETQLKIRFLNVGTLRQELEQLPGTKVSPDLVDFIEYLLVIDHTRRPTALEALQHPYLRSICD